MGKYDVSIRNDTETQNLVPKDKDCGTRGP